VDRLGETNRSERDGTRDGTRRGVGSRGRTAKERKKSNIEKGTWTNRAISFCGRNAVHVINRARYIQPKSHDALATVCRFQYKQSGACSALRPGHMPAWLFE
jgi:hypothetical protein